MEKKDTLLGKLAADLGVSVDELRVDSHGLVCCEGVDITKDGVRRVWNWYDIETGNIRATTYYAPKFTRGV